MNEQRPITDADAGPFYISSTASLAELRPRILKSDDAFAVFGHNGDITAGPEWASAASAEGLYYRDTRYLSRLEMTLNGHRPMLLSSTVSANNTMLTCDLANPDLLGDDGIQLNHGEIHIRRSKFLWNGACHERLAIRNFSLRPQPLILDIAFAADFVDLFEVRGMPRPRRGRLLEPQIGRNAVTIGYIGLDELRRSTMISLDPAPTRLAWDRAVFEIALEPGANVVINLEARCLEGTGDVSAPQPEFLPTMRAARRARRLLADQAVKIVSDNEIFNEAMRRSQADLAMLVTQTEQGPYPYAGIPWFSAAFGRDALITALQTLWLDPEMARGVLRYLAANQAIQEDAASDAEPGKILHEVRFGEMAQLGEVPFRRYYGAVDSTPLFVMLAGAYLDRTNDIKTLRAIWPSIDAALGWIANYGDADGDGFVEYGRKSRDGLVNQGWKDSFDSVFHADGRMAEGPIALAEVQGYVFAAKRAAARIADALGEPEQAAQLSAEADILQTRFERAFWNQELGMYALALDGKKQPCLVRSSNAGQTLFSGICAPGHAHATAVRLLGPSFFSGWGIRTIAAGEARYNPMSYHNGSVWPHDNALIAMGFARYGLREAVAKVFTGLFETASQTDLRRLPELFCGFPRMRGQGPTAYPVACSPQAWAAGTLPALLQASLGLGFDPANGAVSFDRPALPRFLNRLDILNLSMNEARIDVSFAKSANGAVAMAATVRHGDIRATMTS